MKVGRNQQCPCGSGKKFKKCHGGHAGTIDTDDLETQWHMCSYVDPEQECERRWRAHFIAMVYDEVAANDNAIEQTVDALADKKRGTELR